MIIYDLGNIADWLSAIGTLSAVIVALYLANREHKPRAKVTAKYSHIVYDTGIERVPYAICVDIANIGSMPIYLKECTFKVGKNQRMIFNRGDHNVDKLLSIGEMYSHELSYEPIREYFIQRNIKKFRTHIFFEDGVAKRYKTKITLRF
ncbi:MAG: hypothetical protein GX053_01370 [Tissierella sp.]|nr:hypothetical protein [Tissierella sp.]